MGSIFYKLVSIHGIQTGPKGLFVRTSIQPNPHGLGGIGVDWCAAKQALNVMTKHVSIVCGSAHTKI
jgi:hypothetical protein